MAPIRLIGKASLTDEITMLDQLRTTLLSAREQARLIADSTGDERTQFKLCNVAGRAGNLATVVGFLRTIAEEQQMEMSRVELREDLGRS